MKCFVQQIDNASNIKCIGRSELSNKNVDEILQYLSDFHTDVNSIHVIFEELPINEMTERETRRVAELLNSEKFKESHVLFLCQSMTKERNFISRNIEFQSLFSNQVELLVTNSSMVVKTLNQSARTTVAIDKLVQSAVEVLERNSNKFFHTLTHGSFTIQPSSYAGIRDFPLYIESKVNQVILKNYYQKGASTNPPPAASQENTDLEFEEIPVVHNISNLDRSFRSIEKCYGRNESDSNVFESQFRYHRSTSLLHSVVGPKPTVFMLYDFWMSSRGWSCYTMIEILRNIYNWQNLSPYEKVVVLYLGENEPDDINISLKLYRKLYGTEIEKCFSFQNILDVRGMEYKNVIVYLDLHEYYMRHYLIEAITRCKCNLFFVVVEGTKLEGSFLFEEIINTWKTKGLINFFTRENLVLCSEKMKGLKKDMECYMKAEEKPNKQLDLLFQSWDEILDNLNNRFTNMSPEENNKIEGGSIDVQEKLDGSLSTSESCLEIYKMDSKPRGKCLVFISEFPSSHYDSNQYQLCLHGIEAVFSSLHFNVEFCHNYTHSDIIIHLYNISKSSLLAKHDCFAVFFLNADEISEGNTYSYLSSYINLFSTKNCPNLYGKPKLFFVLKEINQHQLHSELKDSFVGFFPNLDVLQRFFQCFMMDPCISDFITMYKQYLPYESALNSLTKLLYFYPPEPSQS